MMIQKNLKAFDCEPVLPVTQGIRPTHRKHHWASENRRTNDVTVTAPTISP